MASQFQNDIDFIFFDAAGTLIRTAESVGSVYAREAASHGLMVDAAEVDQAFRSAWKDMPEPVYARGGHEEVDWRWWYALAGHTFRIAAPVWPAEFDFDACFDALWHFYARADAWRLYDDVLPCLEALRRAGVPLGVLSNFDARLYPVLDGLGLTGYFRTIAVSSELGAVKPQPEIFHRAAALAGVPVHRCLLAGDDPDSDWRGAAAAGMQVFALKRPENSLTDLA